MKHVVMFSSGVGSWAAAKRVAAEHGTENLILLFCDTMIEDPSNYRFLEEAAANVGGELVILRDGRHPWEVFHDRKFQGNSRTAHCSIELKAKMADRWLAERDGPFTVYLGIDWTEEHRVAIPRKRMVGKIASVEAVEAPLCDPPHLWKSQIFDLLKAEGLTRPSLYEQGFPHANCGGFCVRAGMAHFALFLRTHPDRYAWHEAQEIALQKALPTAKPFIRKTVDKELTYLTLKEFREMVEAGAQFDLFDWGGCGCFVSDE